MVGTPSGISSNTRTSPWARKRLAATAGGQAEAQLHDQARPVITSVFTTASPNW